MSVCFEGEKRIFIQGIGRGLGLITKPAYNFEYNYPLTYKGAPYCILNSFKNFTRQMVYSPRGHLTLHQEIFMDTAGSMGKANNTSYIDILPDENGQLLCIIEDLYTHGGLPVYDGLTYEEAYARTKKSFYDFYNKIPKVLPEYEPALLHGAYILWSSTAAPKGYIKYPAVFASNREFPAVFSWDHCFNALGLSVFHPRMALEQMLLLYEVQDPDGQLPDYVNDTCQCWNFAKPPVQGLFFLKMMKHMDFTIEDLERIYHGVEQQVKFYFKYKDSNQDGICEYHHGNDSGQDNSSVFTPGRLVDSPDLTAFLIRTMDMLAETALMLGYDGRAQKWEEKAENLSRLFQSYFICDGYPKARDSKTREWIESQALLPYISLILGKHLPATVINNMADKITGPQYLTQWGIATEALDSVLYADDAYWRGPVWAPSALLLIDGLEESGWNDKARDIGMRFLRLIKEKGFAENFNAKTGEGLRDPSFTWTAGTFIYLAVKYLGRGPSKIQ